MSAKKYATAEERREARNAYHRDWRKQPEARAKELAASARWRTANPDKVAAMDRAKHLRRTYGLTVEAFDQLVDEQDGRCAICRVADDALQVDHDHATGAIRGLLCRHCNRALGHLRDNTETLYAAIRYLESFR